MNFGKLAALGTGLETLDFIASNVAATANIDYLDPTLLAPAPNCCARSTNLISPFVEQNQVTGSVFIC